MRRGIQTVFLCLDEGVEGLILQKSSRDKDNTGRILCFFQQASLHKWVVGIKGAAKVEHRVVYGLCLSTKLIWGNGKLRKWLWIKPRINCRVQPCPLNYVGHFLPLEHRSHFVMFRSSHRWLYDAGTIKLWPGVTGLSMENSGCHSPCFYATVLLIFITLYQQSRYKEIDTCKMLEKCVFMNEASPPKKNHTKQ